MEKLQKIDLWILDNVFQRVADWVWELVPISCFQLARAGVICSVVLRLSFLRVAMLDIFLAALLASLYEVAIRHAESTSTSKFANSFREDLHYWRIFGNLAMIIILVPSPFLPIYLHLYPEFCAIYFLSCQKRPPIERRSFQFPKVVYAK